MLKNITGKINIQAIFPENSVWVSLDTAELGDIVNALKDGTAKIDKVTTNPTLLKQAVQKRREQGEKINIKEYLKKLCSLLGPTRKISLEVTATSENEMVEQGKRLYEMFNPTAGNVWIKIPVTPATHSEAKNIIDGLKAIKRLSDEGIPVNATLIMSPLQACLAAVYGATAVSPFAGRIDDFLAEKAQINKDKFEYYPAEGRK